MTAADHHSIVFGPFPSPQLGISLGIGSLAGQDLTPDTIQSVIRTMTANFSLAFMTTVIGLPVSALLRSLLIVTDARNRRIKGGAVVRRG